MKLFLALLLVSSSVCCASNSDGSKKTATAQPSPSVAPSQSTAEGVPFSKEDDEELSEEPGVIRQQARQEAIKYADENFPGWRVKGIISRQTFDKHYQVTLDLQDGDKNKTIELLLRRFFSERGQPYWKVELFTSQAASRQYKELAYLRFVDGQEFNYDQCRELVLDRLEVDDVPESVQEAIIESYREAAADAREDEPYDPRD
jgi:hypothetical protein